QKALRPLKAILKKLIALQYLDARCEPIIRQFESVLGSLPKSGPIEDPYLSAVIGLFRVVETKDTMRAHGAALLRAEGAPPPDLFADEVDLSDTEPGAGTSCPALTPSPVPPPTPPATVNAERAALWF
ncbi:MAG: DUF3150 domain-containing protein, partial [Steroidobacteraceae bacterium]